MRWSHIVFRKWSAHCWLTATSLAVPPLQLTNRWGTSIGRRARSGGLSVLECKLLMLFVQGKALTGAEPTLAVRTSYSGNHDVTSVALLRFELGALDPSR